MKRYTIAALAALPAFLALLFSTGCGGGGDSGSASSEFPPQDVTAEKEEYYRTFKRVPVGLKNDLESGAITQAEYDAKVADIPLFFSFKTPADIPAGLNWVNGEDLPEIGSPKAIKGGTFHEYESDFPRTLRHLGPDANGTFRPYIVDFMLVKLAPRHPNVTTVDEDGFEHFPGLANEWAIDRENRTVYVRLDPAARWSDGEPVTSDDAMFMFFFMQSRYITQPWYNNFYTEKFTNVTKYDDLTFSIEVAEARPDMDLLVLDLTLVPEHFYKDLGDDFVQRYQWRFQPTTAAYVIHDEDIRKGQSITLTRQKDWWALNKRNYRYRYNYDKIRIDVIREPTKAFEAFLNGDIDDTRVLMRYPEYWYDKLPDSHPLVQKGYVDKIVFYNEVPRPTYGLWINQSKPLLDNKDVRIGIAYASNFQQVIDGYLRGDAVRMNSTAPGYGYFEHPSLKARPFDIEKAREHFAKAGFTRSGADGILMNGQGQRLSFTLTGGNRVLEPVLTILQEEARKAGLELNVEILESTGAWKKNQEKQQDISFTAFGVSPEMYPRYWETYHGVNAWDKPYLADGKTPNPERKPKPQTNNFLMTAYPELDAMIDRYDRSESAVEMRDLAWKMEEFMHEEAVWVPGYVQPYYRLAKWRWMQYPDDFNVKGSVYHWEWYLDWIDPEIKEETLRAMRRDETFPPVIKEYSQYKQEE